MILTNKNITLIIRQKNRALPLKKFLKLKGFEVLVEPVFKIKAIKHKNINYKNYSAIMFTSATTVEILEKENIDNKFKNIQTFCVGKVTYETAIKYGYNCIKTTANTGQLLEKEIIKFVKPSNNKILVIGGKKIAHNPIAGFNTARLKSERIIIYDTIPIKNLSKESIEVIKNNRIKNIIIYSPETAKTFINLTKNIDINNIKIICLGKKTGNIFKKNNWKKIQVVNETSLKTFANAIIED